MNLFVFALFIAAESTVLAQATCPATPVAGNLRIDCGTTNTTQQSCTASNCCWSPLPAGTAGPTCYRPQPATCPATPPEPANRLDCGNVTTTPNSCVQSGCCWNPPPAGTPGPACYRLPPTTCPTTPPLGSSRINCGTATTTPLGCIDLGCCWNTLAAGQIGPNCFKNIAQPTTCPRTPFPPLARVNCPQATMTTTSEQCVQLGCCWDQLAPNVNAPNCYDASATAPGFGPPGSDPGTVLPILPTTGNAGSYAVIANSPIAALGVSLVPRTNKLVYVERFAGGKDGTTHTYTFDPATLQFAELTVDTDVFCVGGALLPDGRVLTMGGWTGDASLRGMRFLADGGNWRQDATKAALLVPRWYPTALLRPDGRLWIFGGATDMQPPGVNQPNAELIPHAAGDRTVTLPLLQQTDGSNLYPFAYIIPPDTNRNSATIWLFASARSQLLNMSTLATIVELPQAPPGQGNGARTYPLSGSAVMLPLVADANNNYPPAQVVICGGGTGYTPESLGINTCVRTTPSRGAQATWTVETMPGPRVFAEMVALPDQTYLILNGAGRGWSGFAVAGNPQRSALRYNPNAAAGQRFTVLNSTTIARLYHSEAILALDGRVIVSGSTPNYDGNVNNSLVIHPNDHRIEAYSPPYLTNGKARPVISAVTSAAGNIWNYNTVYNITTTLPSLNAARASISLIAQGFATHAVHMGEKFIVPFIVARRRVGNTNTWVLSVRSPRDANIAQPQWYTLWVVDDGTPSVGRWIQIGGVPAVTGPQWPFGN